MEFSCQQTNSFEHDGIYDEFSLQSTYRFSQGRILGNETAQPHSFTCLPLNNAVIDYAIRDTRLTAIGWGELASSGFRPTKL
ncbi:hypothetical protein I4U23_001361 [Adineta vaga]|nr:hypothetical protein I4U23_001361 [Adineta vaga]